MTIDDRTLAGVTTLVARHQTQEHRCTIERGEDGTPAFVLADGRRFRSPSAAGSALMGGIACNGWRFWSVAPTGGTQRDAPAPARPAACRGKLLRRVPTQRGVRAGYRRWFCAACNDGFLADRGKAPVVCPAGHTAG